MPTLQPPSQIQSEPPFIIRMEGITKRFPGIVANADVHLRVARGAFHAVIGENGAGKSTLLNVLYGRYAPDAGRILIQDEDVTAALHSPADAIRRGLGLVSQHYALIPALTVLENVVLGAEPTRMGGFLDRRKAAEQIAALTDRLGLAGIDLNARADRLSVAAQQKVEILKALFRGANILLLDEPTATLAPQEADALFTLLHSLVDQGATIVFVTHKLREVMAHSDAVTVLRGGRNAGDFVTRQTDPHALLRQMIGDSAARGTGADEAHFNSGGNSDDNLDRELDRSSAAPESAVRGDSPLLDIVGVSVRNARQALAVDAVSLALRSGEIVGIAGVDGSGQRELSEAIVGLRPIELGTITLAGEAALDRVALNGLSVRSRQELGVAYIPEDRHRAGMILDFSVAENYLLGHETSRRWGGGVLLNPATLMARAKGMIAEYDVRMGTRDASAPARDLSGGNQQKIVVARAMESRPQVLIACQPTRGLDRGASEFVYRTLRRAREAGLGVLLFSLDLDEILELSDRIAVMFNGRVVGLLSRAEATAERIGALMTGSAL